MVLSSSSGGVTFLLKKMILGTALDNTADDIQEARDDTGGDDARALQEMIVLNSVVWQRKREERVPCVFGP